MNKNHLTNIWLRFVLKRMKDNLSVTDIAKMGHIRKNCYSTNVEDIAGNINSAEHLARMVLLWAVNSVINENNDFVDEMTFIADFTMTFMEQHWRDFCDAYDPKLNRKNNDNE